MLVPWDESVIWLVVLGFIVSFILALGVGANDVANSFGTSVGSKVLSLRTACILATVFEIAGAVLIGYKVSDTVRKGILDVSLYNETEKELMMGSLAALGGSAVWQFVATYLRMPVSGTHSIVGATLGFTLVARGPAGVKWTMMAKIVGSWFVSPVMSGATSAGIFFLMYILVLKRSDAVEMGLRILPVIYAFTIFVNVFSVVHDGPKLLYLHMVPWWGALIISFCAAIITFIVVQLVAIPMLKKQLMRHWCEDKATPMKGIWCSEFSTETTANEVKFTFGDSTDNSRSASPHQSKCISLEDLSLRVEKEKAGDHLLPPTTKGAANGFLSKDDQEKGLSAVPSTVSIGTTRSSSSHAPLLSPEKPTQIMNGNTANGHKEYELNAEEEKEPEEKDHPQVGRLFSFLQILTAIFGSFAHGGNDVSNCIGPLIALWLVFSEGSVAQKSETPIYLLFYGGVGISIGLWVWGRRVIETIGQDLTKVTPSSGFTIEIGSALTVLLASKVGLPISTTHCKVGSVVFVGWARSNKKGVDWKLFRNIVLAWVVTVPVTGILSAGLMFLMQNTAL